RIAEVHLRDTLGQAVATLAIGLGGRDVDAEALAGLLVHHRLLQAGDDVSVADQDRDRLTLLRALQRLLADFGDGVLETDDAVFFDLHAELGVAAGGSGGGRLAVRGHRGHHGRREESPALSRPLPVLASRGL